MRAQDRTVEERIAQIASRQHGVVTRAQLGRAAVTRAEIETGVRRGWLIRVHRGVYRVGHIAPSVEATYLGAVYAAGEGALVSGRAAAYLWRIVKESPPMPGVTAPTERRIVGVGTHRSRSMNPRDRATARGVPVMSVPATVVCLAATLSLDDLARV